MSGHLYLGGAGNLFEDGDIDDETFLRNSRPKISYEPNYGARPRASDNPLVAEEEQRQLMLQRQAAIEQRTLDSAARSVGILRDSERVGAATAEELLRQREQLERTSQRLDEINANLRFSQKHLNGIKSVFSSLKNYIAGKSEATPAAAPPAASTPAPEAPAPGELPRAAPSTELGTGGSRQMSRLLDANLDEMAGSISRLKGLATDMGQEIESQNDLIDTITDKAEGADLTINRQNKQMNKLLGK